MKNFPEGFESAKQYRMTKHEVNSQGPDEEGDELYIGSREEIDQAKKRNKTEGRAKTLKEYIKLNGEVVFSQEEVSRLIKLVKDTDPEIFLEFNRSQSNDIRSLSDIVPGNFAIQYSSSSEVYMYYVDTNLNIKFVSIQLEKIADLKDEMNNHDKINSELAELGFSNDNSGLGFNLLKSINTAQKLQEQLENKEKLAATRKKFDL